MKQYKELLQKVMNEGVIKTDRTGVGTKSIFGYQMRFDLKEGFPIVTLKKTAFRIFTEELIWMISGGNNIKPLLEKNVHIWDEWPMRNWFNSDEYKAENLPDMTDFGVRCMKDEDFNEVYLQMKRMFCDRILNDDAFADKFGYTGEIYGAQWRRWTGAYMDNGVLMPVMVDQLAQLIEDIKTTPNSRRLILSAWNVSCINQMALPPCHNFCQFMVVNGELSCMLNMRSNDLGLGAPFDIGQYALLTHMIAKLCGLGVGELVYTIGDAHIYLNQFDMINTILEREPKELPKLIIHGDQKTIDDFKYEDFELVGYDPHPAIKAQIAV